MGHYKEIRRQKNKKRTCTSTGDACWDNSNAIVEPTQI